ncbi:hypothetical protein EBQ91_01430 [bacterium]|nr:hypothetical protein [bacterium]
MAIKISGTTVIDDSRNLVNINSGLGVGIQSGGNSVGTGITVLNFVGTGNTFAISGTTANISISGGGGSIGTTGITTQTVFSNPNIISTDIALTNPNHNYGMFGPVSIGATVTVTVGAGNTFVIY